MILLGDKEGNVCPIHWQSKKIKRGVKSTLAAECLALQEGSDAGFYIKTMLTDILKVEANDVGIELLHESLHSSKTLEEKRLILDEAIMKDMMQKREINKVQWIEKKYQIADPLTKGTASSEVLFDVLNRGNISHLFG